MTAPIENTLSSWLTALQHRHVSSIDLGLERIGPLAGSLSLTQFSCPVITVGGTNGKGSTVRLLECFYLAAGYRVAAYTSPHLISFNERLRINGEMLSDESWIEAFSEIERARGEQSLSFFEFTTLASLWLAEQHALDVILLEVGLGGRLDAVNVVEPDLSVVTSIGLDHTDWLGDNRESIGREKAGIFRKNKPVVCGDPNPPQSILNRATELGSPFYCFQKDFRFIETLKNWVWESETKRYLNLPYPALKLQNAATALMAAELMQSRLPLTQFALLKGLKKAQLPGRFEQVSEPSPMVFDVAHNPDSAAYLAEQLQRYPISGRDLMVLGMLEDKDIKGTVAPLLPLADSWYVGGLTVIRGASGNAVMAELATLALENCYNFSSLSDALQAALKEATPEDRIVVFGSFHTVSEAKAALLFDHVRMSTL